MRPPGIQQTQMDPRILYEICEASPRGVLIATADGKIMHINRRMAEALKINIELETGRSLRKSRIFGENRIPLLMQLIDENREIEFKNNLMKDNEERLWEFKGHIFPGGFIIEGEDVTNEVKRLESAEKLEKKYEQQIKIAQRLQRDLFPTNFQKKRIDVHTHLTMAEDLAGDFFSVTELSPNAIGVVIGDVVGKGIPASLMAMSIHTLFMQEAKLMRSPSELLSLVNGMLHSRFKSDFWYATAFYARILVTNLTVTYSRAGHEFPLVYRAASGEVDKLIGDGLPLGMFSNSFYQTCQIQLQSDDKLLLFTDGLPDAMNPDGERFGHDRLANLLKDNGDKTGKEVLDLLINELEKFTDGAQQVDDIAIAIFSVVPNLWTTWEIPPRSFEELLDSVAGELEDYGIDENTIFDIRLALDECIINAQKHGNKKDPEKPVYVSYLINQNCATFHIRDDGEGFDYEQLPDPTLDENVLLDHGRGVYITREFMDDVEFNETGNEIIITKHFHPRI